MPSGTSGRLPSATTDVLPGRQDLLACPRRFLSPDYSWANTSPKRERGTANGLPSLARRASVEHVAPGSGVHELSGPEPRRRWATRRAGPYAAVRARGGCAAKCVRLACDPPTGFPFFFRPPPAFGHPPIRRAGPGRRHIFLADNRLGPAAGLTSVGIGEQEAPLARGGMDQFAGRYLTQCPKRTTQTETLRQSARNFRNLDDFRATVFGGSSFLPRGIWHEVLFPLRFPRRCPTCATITGEMSLGKPRFRRICLKTRKK